MSDLVRLLYLGQFSPTCLRTAFRHADPESAKKQLDLTVFFALLGSASVKAARRMLMKVTPVWHARSNAFTIPGSVFALHLLPPHGPARFSEMDLTWSESVLTCLDARPEFSSLPMLSLRSEKNIENFFFDKMERIPQKIFFTRKCLFIGFLLFPFAD